MSENRFFKHTVIGDVQAWLAPSGETAVALSWYGDVKHGNTETAYTSHSLNLSAADARAIAADLIIAADHAECVTRMVAAADLGIAEAA